MLRRLLVQALCSTAFAIGQAQAAARVGNDLQMMAESEPFRQAADAFIAHAIAGDAAASRAMLSPSLVARSGDAAIGRALQAQILPFFAQGGATGRSVTVTRTSDVGGQQGFAFYMWLAPRDAGALARPFTVYLVREQGRIVVANIVPDRLIEGRHR